MIPSADRPTERLQFGWQDVYVLRHGESTFNARQDREVDPIDFDARLTDRGREQAATVASQIRVLAPNLIVTSPLTRALQTAEIIACGRVPVLVEPLIREWKLNSCDIGRPVSMLRREFPEFSFDHLAETWWYEGDDGESPNPKGVIVEPRTLFLDRVHRFRQWLQQHPGKCIVMVGHNAFIIHLTRRKLGNCELISLTGQRCL